LEFETETDLPGLFERVRVLKDGRVNTVSPRYARYHKYPNEKKSCSSKTLVLSMSRYLNRGGGGAGYKAKHIKMNRTEGKKTIKQLALRKHL